MNAITPQRSAAISETTTWFRTLARLAKDAGGGLVLSSFGEDPASGEELPPLNQHFEIGDGTATAMLDTAAAWSAEPGRNVYAMAATVRDDLGQRRKGREVDVRAVLMLVQDFDALTDGDRAAAYLDRLPHPPAVVIETSPGSFQCFYVLDKPASVAKAKEIAQALVAATGCDSCSVDMSHVWRIPGLPNWPTAKKVSKGRSKTPFVARMVKTGCDLKRVSLDTLRQAAKSRAPDTAAPTPAEKTTTPATAGTVWRPIPKRLALKLWHAPADGEDKSAAAYGAIKAYSEHGHSADEIIAAFDAHPESAAALHYTSLEQLAADIARSTGKDSSCPKWVEDMNARYHVVNDGGQVLVFRPAHDPELNRKKYERIRFEDLRKLHMHETIEVGTNANGRPIFQDVGTAWLKHPRRKQFPGGVVFAPGQQPAPDMLNLWQGYGVDPKPGDWSLMQSHIRDVLCDRDDELYRYFMSWLARCVQRPAEAGEVAIVLRGGRGVGKGIVAHRFGRLLGQHYVPIAHARHLVGNFNGHLRDGVFCFADEAFYAGDRQHESVLKSLITEPYLQIEAKYANAVTVRNVLHLMLATNEAWAIPAGVDERRFFVLDVPATRQGDHAYFAALAKQMEAGGGAAAMLHNLLTYDLSGFEVRNVPQTAALAAQKTHSLRGTAAWLHEALQAGEITGHPWPDEPGRSKDRSNKHKPGALPDELMVSRNVAYLDFTRHSDRQREYRPDSRSVWSKALRTILGDLVRGYRPRAANPDRERYLIFASLAKCRRAFEAYLRNDRIEWRRCRPSWTT